MAKCEIERRVKRAAEILKLEDEDNDELIGQEVMIAVDDALEKFVLMREVEGQKLIEDIEKRIYLIKDKINEAKIHSNIMGSDHCPVGLEIE